MKILVLCKRFSTGKDSLLDRYGRLFNLPEGLAALGWEVEVMSIAYRMRRKAGGGLLAPRFEWKDFPLSPFGLCAYFKTLSRAGQYGPDIVWSSSDAPHAIIGDRVARSLGVPHVIDLYDDYESFGLTKIPGMRPAFRNACRRASAITVVSEVLAGIVSERISFARRIHHLPNGVAPFQSCLGRAGLLEFLGLPPGSRLVGAVGALDDGRGIGDLFDAFDILSAEMPDLHLVLVGKERGRSLLRRGPRIHRLGVVSHSLAMSILAALDVSVVCNRDGAFARSCHPMKLVEAISVQTPVVAAAVGEVRRLLASRPDSLFEPGDPVSLARRIAGHLRQPKALDPALAKRWDEVSKKLSDLLFEILLDKP